MYKLFNDYVFKSEATKQQWKDFLENLDEEIRLSYMGRMSSLSILINFRRCFNITPYALKNSKSIEHADYRLFALYLLVHYSKDTLNDIADDFNTSIDELQSIRSNQYLHLEYEVKIKTYFEPLKADFKEVRRTELGLAEITLEKIIYQRKHS